MTSDAQEQSLFAESTLPDGRKIRLAVPERFGPDEFETCVGMLIQLRVASEARRQSKLAVVKKPGLVKLDGSKLG